MQLFVTLMLAVLVLTHGQAFGAEFMNGQYRAIFSEKFERLTPANHYCFAHCATRTVQETRITCSLGDPGYLDPDIPIPPELRAVWNIHEETWLLEEQVRIDSTCHEQVTVRQATQLAQPQYWPEDDIWNPVPYYDTPLYQFNCGDLQYDPLTNQTATFRYRIVVNYRFGCK